jgi:hypothetical protein
MLGGGVRPRGGIPVARGAGVVADGLGSGCGLLVGRRGDAVRLDRPVQRGGSVRSRRFEALARGSAAIRRGHPPGFMALSAQAGQAMLGRLASPSRRGGSRRSGLGCLTRAPGQALRDVGCSRAVRPGGADPARAIPCAIRQLGIRAPAHGDLEVDLGLLSLPAGLLAVRRGLVALHAGLGAIERRAATVPCRFSVRVERRAIRRLGDPLLALVGKSLALIRAAFALVGSSVALLRGEVALGRPLVALVGQPIAFIRMTLSQGQLPPSLIQAHSDHRDGRSGPSAVRGRQLTIDIARTIGHRISMTGRASVVQAQGRFLCQ